MLALARELCSETKIRKNCKLLQKFMKYKEELTRAMTWLGDQPDTLFIGQAVECPGTAMFETLKNVSNNKRIEFPVAEDMQMGMSIGMALDEKTVPISIYPRWNFLLLAVNQIVNHLDKITLMADKPYQPKVIIRVGIGSERPLHPQHQHIGDFTQAFKLMCPNINIVRLDNTETIVETYISAYKDTKSSIIVEWGDFYSEK
jgi:pyruvate/2-oxoglutarate/acetoin dehydrogenase E1 component